VVDGGSCGEDHQIGTRSHHGVVVLWGVVLRAPLQQQYSVAGCWGGAGGASRKSKSSKQMRRLVDRGGSFDPGMIAEQNGSELNATPPNRQ